jgi:hypothetical protein
MEESQFFIPNLPEGDSAQQIQQYLRNLRGIFSVQIDIVNQTIHVRHIQNVKRRELARTLNRLGFPEKIVG